MTCNKFKLIDKSPWGVCDVHPEYIPDKYNQIPEDQKEKIECPNYEFNPDWEK